MIRRERDFIASGTLFKFGTAGESKSFDFVGRVLRPSQALLSNAQSVETKILSYSTSSTLLRRQSSSGASMMRLVVLSPSLGNLPTQTLIIPLIMVSRRTSVSEQLVFRFLVLHLLWSILCTDSRRYYSLLLRFCCSREVWWRSTREYSTILLQWRNRDSSPYICGTTNRNT